MKIKKILIANRGEIALRIMRTCRELGIKSVAVYSDADEFSPHTLSADESYHIGPAESKSSYLNIQKIIDVAKKSNCDAIHPGYGFLAENSGFAKVCEDEKIKFIGPSSSAMQKMGNKLNARKIARDINVPIIKGSGSDVFLKDDFKNLAKEIGYPLLVKAAGGGGGKGMRLVKNVEQLESALREASSESQSSFSDSSVYLEQYIDKPHHIEVQIIADEHNNVLVLGERECSIQRRHQKLIEETPSPFADENLRNGLFESAKKLVLASGYTNAGTVEFIVDENKNFYFLEMNTRLQVEHPVTEMVTGLDLVRMQIESASGEKFEMQQEGIHRHGCAIECRVYCEDPYNNFIPNSGFIYALDLPAGPFIRVDCGVTAGRDVTMFYDPLIAKIISWGTNRPEAINRMQRALEETLIVGPQTTIPFSLFVLQNKKFLSGNYNTHFTAEEFDPAKFKKNNSELAGVIASALEFERLKNQKRKNLSISSNNSNWFRIGLKEGLRY